MRNFFNKTSKKKLKKYMLSANFQASIIAVISPCTTWVNLPWTRDTRQLDHLRRQFVFKTELFHRFELNSKRFFRIKKTIYLTVILRGRAGYELIYITNEAVGRVGYYQLISGKSEKNNCFSKSSSNSLDFFR